MAQPEVFGAAVPPQEVPYCARTVIIVSGKPMISARVKRRQVPSMPTGKPFPQHTIIYNLFRQVMLWSMPQQKAGPRCGARL